MAEPFRWGIIGLGRIAERFVESMAVVDGAEITAVASRDSERAEAFAHRHQISRWYQGYEELCHHPKLDAVYIATPIRHHYEHCALFLEAGVAVLCEKSFTINAKQAQALSQLAKKKRVFLMEAMWTPFTPIYTTVREWLDNGEIGDIKHMQSSFGFAIPRNLTDREFRHDLGGGVLLEMGVYNVAISQWVANQFPAQIQAQGWLGESRVDEAVMVNLNYGSGQEVGLSSQFHCSYQAQLSNDFVISGTKGEIRIAAYFWEECRASLNVGEDIQHITKPFRGRGFEYQIEHVMECIAGGDIESPVMSHQRSIDQMRIMDEIRRQISLRYDFE